MLGQEFLQLMSWRNFYSVISEAEAVEAGREADVPEERGDDGLVDGATEADIAEFMKQRSGMTLGWTGSFDKLEAWLG